MKYFSYPQGTFSRSSLTPSHSGAGAAWGKHYPKRAMAVVAGAVLMAALAIGYVSPLIGVKNFGFLALVVGLVWVVARQPRWGLVLFLILSSTLFMPEFFAPWIDSNLVYLLYEFLLITLVGRSLLAGGTPGVFQRLYSSPVAISLTVFAAIVAAKSLVILIDSRFAHDTINSVYLFDRSLSFYLLFVPVLIYFNEVRWQRWLIRVMFVLAGIVVTGVILQVAFPHNQLLGQFTLAQSLKSDTPAVDPFVQRLRPPGGAMVLACFWMGLMNLILRPWSWRRLAVFLPLTLLMLAGVMLEFNRSYLVPIAALLMLALFINRKNVRMKLLAVLAITAAVVVLFSSATGTLEKYVSAAVTRYGSTFSSEAMEAQSQTSREIEINYAWIAIRSAPAFGIGLDELYRPHVPGMLDNLRWYIHNAYIWFWTYFGLAGLAAFAAVLMAVLLRGIFNWAEIKDQFLQASLVGMIFTIVTLAAADWVAPKFYDYVTVPVVAVIIGLVEAIIIKNQALKDGR